MRSAWSISSRRNNYPVTLVILKSRLCQTHPGSVIMLAHRTDVSCVDRAQCAMGHGALAASNSDDLDGDRLGRAIFLGKAQWDGEFFCAFRSHFRADLKPSIGRGLGIEKTVSVSPYLDPLSPYSRTAPARNTSG